MRMTKQRGYPDRRGMGAQSDFIAEQFVPSEHYKAQQMAMVQKLIATGVKPEQVASMFFVPSDLLSLELTEPEPHPDSPAAQPDIPQPDSPQTRVTSHKRTPAEP
jgi:hypothetical protein